jgi:DNA-binding XRE family transcriptional regulator
MLREMREKAGLSHQALAEKAGLSIRTVVYAEEGRDVRMSTARRLARALDVSVDDLFPQPERVA